MILSVEEKECIQHAIALAELKTSGELRVCVEQTNPSDPYTRAVACFEELAMHRTQLRNGVLIYVAMEDKKFAIIGDIGIHQKVSADFWNTTQEAMLSYFQQNKLVDGILKGVELAGDSLAVFFPRQIGDTNELSNEVIEIKR